MATTAQRVFNCPRINIIRPGGLHHMWPCYRQMLERACEYSLLDNDNVEEYRKDCISGSKLLVEIGNDSASMGVAILEVIETKEGDALHVVALAGEDMGVWLDDFIDFLRHTSKRLECHAGVTLSGRVGWVRELRRYGFEHLYTIMRMKTWVSD